MNGQRKEYKIKKKICLVLSILFLMGICMIPFASAKTDDSPIKEKLSDMTADECFAFLIEQGVEVSEHLRENFRIMELIEDLEEDPYRPNLFNHPPYHFFVESVRRVVLDYYGLDENPEGYNNRYNLVYSDLFAWDPDTMPNYNCYSYALGLTSSWHYPGFSSFYTYQDSHSISVLANGVKSDLSDPDIGLGYSCVRIDTTRPSSASGWYRLIAVRKTNYDPYGVNDYHFARYISSGWRHKPADTAVLTFRVAPKNSLDWCDESYKNGVYYQPFVWYNSNIRYIRYKANHGDTTLSYTYNNYHSGNKHYFQYGYKCQDCGDYTNTYWVSRPCSGNPCITPETRDIPAVIHKAVERSNP